MADVMTVPGLPGVTVHLRTSARARRMTLRVGRADGRVTLTLPRRLARGEAAVFVAQQADWIARQIAATPSPRPVRVGGTVPLRGWDVPVVAGGGRAARLTEGAVAVPDDDRAGPRVAGLLRGLARDALAEAVARHALAARRVPGRLTLRDTRSRWGSCTSRGDLMFSWRLIMAPEAVLDYVAAHEVAHLIHMDHSPRFWAELEGLLPGHAPQRAWLRRNGAGLQAVDFSGG
jgi:predicted metal-dependent hydrolase